MPLPSSIWNQARQNREPPPHFHWGRQPERHTGRWADKQATVQKQRKPLDTHTHLRRHIRSFFNLCILITQPQIDTDFTATCMWLQFVYPAIWGNLTWIFVLEHRGGRVIVAGFSDYYRAAIVKNSWNSPLRLRRELFSGMIRSAGRGSTLKLPLLELPRWTMRCLPSTTDPRIKPAMINSFISHSGWPLDIKRPFLAMICFNPALS